MNFFISYDKDQFSLGPILSKVQILSRNDYTKRISMNPKALLSEKPKESI